MSEFSSPFNRRTLFRNGSFLLLGKVAVTDLLAFDQSRPTVRVGIVTDLHYADKPANGSRHYRDSLAKLTEAAKQFSADKPDFVVELGDFIDAAATVETEQSYLEQISKVFNTVAVPKHYVLGNHCVDMLTKDEFLQGIGKKESFYSFDVGGFHFVILDACFRNDGKAYGRKNSQWDDANIPAHELEWLQNDLKSTSNKVVILAHQRLDVAKQSSVKNATEVRKILEQSEKVLAVFQGHSHKNDHQEISGIHYCTLVAMVEGARPDSNGYSMLDLYDNGVIRVTGFRNQASYNWK